GASSGQPLGAALDDKGADAVRALAARLQPGAAVRTRPDDKDAGAIAGGDPHLAAMKTKAGARADGLGAQRGGVRAGLRLGEAEGAGDGLTRAQPGYVGALLLFAAIEADDLGDHVGDGHAHGYRRVSRRDLAQGEGVGDGGGRGAAVLLRHLDAEEAE